MHLIKNNFNLIGKILERNADSVTKGINFHHVHPAFTQMAFADIGLWLAHPICNLLLRQSCRFARLQQVLQKKLIFGGM